MTYVNLTYARSSTCHVYIITSNRSISYIISSCRNSGSNSGSYTFSISNYNGTLRLVAVAVSDNQFGSIEQSVVVKDNIIITPSYPRFLTTNDTCVIPVQIHNATGREGFFKANFILDNNSIHYSPSEKLVQIKNNETEIVIFKMVAPHIPVPIQSKIIVSGNNYKSNYDVNISLLLKA